MNIAAFEPRSGRFWHRRIAVQPVANDKMIVLFRPQHTRKCLPLDTFCIVRHISRNDIGVKLICLLDTRVEYAVEIDERPVFAIAFLCGLCCLK